ncbi:homocitrate synthase [Rhodobacter sphaeroides]|jgi:2-isopropylmalate synthase|uniref:2-isopropylmalate synthase n=1 Tax=Cereibacter sphaeroides (strain ATCC 17023 / DSM 158 / JCM 6121 / CCUG 31486 / LMG 2827 / NBRC 12203 / NCIMB 8253 / ATH 2.4.1.) TaxID=272943 RepID=Q3IV11_CERS4|nr:isopropylmalate/homocitrate synthase [Cereibacter sphaeroides]ABA81623.1 isopropylmalate/homocitrate synthase [Cereibacter sphaeroides 2.4.1]AMJ49765.1 homocitrate synthase [Cereibacter sphaeroides]ANS36524.1 homocitrate synthase [Cereibacter sphaeroides]ATN65537.1 homocitrate synthase [Cereibacter sphaeroides]AXC64152.1 homocitrate synthase [Cereibacter sphaeroides 2.4.1]
MQRKRTLINDATLREGNQASGVRFSVHDSVAIATALDGIGVDMIEIGHPLAGPYEHQRTEAVAKLGLGAKIIAHARAHRTDIEAVSRTGATWVGIFLGVNDITTKARVIGRSTTELIRMVADAVKVAKDCGLNIRYSCEDASRTNTLFLVDVFGAAIDAGADRICYADTLGIAEPAEVARKVTLMKSEFPDAEVEVHLHDDRGLAMANSLAAIDAGVDSISVSVNALGERCGITDLATLLVNLGFRGERALPDISELRALSRLVAMSSNTPFDALRPIVGDNAFKHGSKLHQRATQYEPRAYDWIKEFIYRHDQQAVGQAPGEEPSAPDQTVSEIS